MNSKQVLVVVAVAFLGCFTGQSEGGMMDHFNANIPEVTCSSREILNMFRCMTGYASGTNFLNFINMMREDTCNPDYLNCQSVATTQQCLNNMPSSEASDACKAEMDQITDYQFSWIGYPCRTQDFISLCAAELGQL